MKTNAFLLSNRSTAALFAVVTSLLSADAATTWNGSVSGSWATPANWTTTLPAGDLVTYGAGTGVGTAVANPTQSLDGTYSVLGFSVGNNAASPIVINAGTGGSITIGTSGILLNSATGGNFTLNPDIIMAGAQSFTTGTGRGITVNNVANGGFLLTVNTAGATSTTAINGLLSGAGGLTKSGPGSMTLSGLANTFSGAVTVGGGTLSIAKLAVIGSNSSLGTGSGASALVLNGGTLTYTGAGGDTTDRAIDMRAGAAISNNSATGDISFTAANVIQGGTASARTLTLGGSNAGNNTFSSVLGNSGTGANISTLQKNGVGKWIVTGTQTYTGATIINQGTLSVGGSTVLGGVTGSAADAGNIVFGQNLNSGALEFETAANLGPADQIRFRNTGGTAGSGGALRYVGTTDQTVSKTLQCDSTIGIRLESDSVGGSITFNGAFNQTTRPLYLGGTGTGNNRLDIAFTSTGTLTKRDAGTWILGAANTYSGITTINGGVLQVGNGGTTGTLGTNSVDNNASLVFNRSNDLAVGNAISGSGTLTQAGAGTTTLGAANTYAGTTQVNQGALILGGSTASAGRIDVSGGATLGGGGGGGITTLADGGILAPGNADLLDNQLDLASVSLAGGSILKYELGAPLANPLDTTPDFYSDHVAMTGALILNGTLQITPVTNAFTDFGSPVSGNRWLLMAHAAGGLTDNTLDVNTPANLSLLAAGLSYRVDTSNDGFVYLAVVPEAQSGVLLAAGLLLLRMRRSFSRG